MADIAGIILTGGLSRRMGGGDKSLLSLGGKPVLAHVVDRLSPQVGTLAINANGDPARFERFALPVFADTVPDHAGPLAGVLAAMDWASANTGCTAIITAAGDTPFFPENLVQLLCEAAKDEAQTIAGACCGGRRHPTFALWPLALRHSLETFLVGEGNRRVTSFIERHDFVDVDFPPVDFNGRLLDPFFNINTPQDLAEAARMMESMPS